MLPDTKKYFSEKFSSPDDVPHNKFYQNQGTKILKMLKKVVHDCDNEEALKHDVHEIVKIHEEKKVPVDVVKSARPVIMKFLTQKTGMTEEERAAWKQLMTETEKLLEKKKH
ncbi:unnamed protein product [Soboliphyme baturini]|uniref:GLOBIN domain-containing protein n=1 Tax=Soboliphyme baturini TaxID=241478 RepID=A0A183J9P4_9BILA|nr:unnamed protein product [Soboliphyme baturini]